MKILNPAVSIIIASHLKPAWLPSSLGSVLCQTRNDIQIIIADSGAWISKPHEMVDVYDQFSRHPLVDWVTLSQQWPVPLHGHRCPYTWVWNRILESEIVRGSYVSFFTDDDLYLPRYIEVMAGFLDTHPEYLAAYCSQDRVKVIDGEVIPAGPTLLADTPIDGAGFLYHVDMIQMMMQRRVFDLLDPPWFDEDPTDDRCRCADGRFMNRIGELGVVANVPEILCTHRYTAESLYN